MRPRKAGFGFRYLSIILTAVLGMTPVIGFSGETDASGGPHLVSHYTGYFSPAVFVLAYVLVVAEEFTHLRWTPVIAAGYVATILTHMWINAAQF
jgi:hypothetical protein